MPRPRIFDHEAMLAVYDSGEHSGARLAKQFSVSVVAIRKVLIRSGRKPATRRGRAPMFDHDAMVKAFDDGERNPSILGARFGVSRQRIREILVTRGRQPRSRHDEEYRAEVSERMGGNDHAALNRGAL